MLLSGCSAGAIGALLNVDFLSEQLPSSVQVRGAPQSGWFYPNITTYSAWERGEDVFPLPQAMVDLWQPALMSECEAEHTTRACLSTDVYFSYI